MMALDARIKTMSGAQISRPWRATVQHSGRRAADSVASCGATYYNEHQSISLIYLVWNSRGNSKCTEVNSLNMIWLILSSFFTILWREIGEMNCIKNELPQGNLV